MTARKRFPTAKPYPSFPLTPRADGRFAKKIRGVGYVFGADGDWRKALDEYLAVARPAHAGDHVPTQARARQVPTVRQLANRYLDLRKRDVDSGAIKLGTWDDYRDSLDRFCHFVGVAVRVPELSADHLDRFANHLIREEKMSASRYHVHRANVRAWLKHAVDAGWIKPFPMGTAFKRIPKGKVRAARKKRMLPAAHVRVLLGAATGQLRAMMWLALNGGFGNTDCATLPKAAVDLKAGVIDYRRTKTNVERVVPLWPETVDALRPIMAERPADALVFRTKYGNPWVREWENDKGTVVTNDNVAQAFRYLVDSFCLLDAKHRDPAAENTFADAHPGVGFYWLRHVHRTHADEARDQHAAMRIMGHAFPGMSDVYVEEISTARLSAVVNHVRSKLLSP